MPCRATRRLIAVAATSFATVSACHSTAAPQVPPSSPSSVVPTATATTPARDERAAVEADYRRFWSVSWNVDKQPPARWRPVLAGVSVDPVLTRLLAGTKAQREAGIRLYGQVVARPAVTRIAQGRAEIKDCQDASNAGQADAASGKRRTVGVARTPVTAFLVRGSDGVWRVSDVRYPGGSC